MSKGKEQEPNNSAFGREISPIYTSMETEAEFDIQYGYLLGAYCLLGPVLGRCYGYRGRSYSPCSLRSSRVGGSVMDEEAECAMMALGEDIAGKHTGVLVWGWEFSRKAFQGGDP